MKVLEFLKSTDYYTQDALLKHYFKICQERPHVQIAMLITTMEKSEKLYKEFKELYVSIPFWYLDSKLHRSHSARITFDNGASIAFLNNPMKFRGLSLDMVGIYDDYEWTIEDIQNFLPSMYRGIGGNTDDDRLSKLQTNVKRFS